MRIRLYWRPLMGTTKNPAATNALIDWYVLGPDGSTEMRAYEGAAFVVLRGDGDKRTILIREGSIFPKTGASRGGLADPVGKATISGKAVARVSEVRVKDAISELEKTVGTK